MTPGKTAAELGKYEIIRAIGRGGMGEVFLARDLRLQRKVAIKYLRGDLSQDDWRAHLEREAQTLAKLNHPNIVQIYDIIYGEEAPALVMEYVDGRNLHIQLRERDSDRTELLRWLTEIAAGVAAAHDAGIIHNDLKAENVLIGVDNIAKVTDFGIAAHNSDASEDIHALGTLATKILGEEAHTPANLNLLLQQMTHKNPSKRPGSREVAEGLRLAWLESTQEETALPSLVQSDQPRRTGIIVGAGTILVLLAISFSWYYKNKVPAHRDYVAVLPTSITTASGVVDQQQDLLRSSIQQALQQSVINATALALVSSDEARPEDGNLHEIRLALGADELVISRMDCPGARSCELTIERLGGPDLSVQNQRTTSVIVDMTLETYSIVQRQWQQLYPGSTVFVDPGKFIDEETYQKFLTLYEASHMGGARQGDVLVQLEPLLAKANRFMPLYLLYAHSALDVYDESGDPEYLDKLQAALTHAETFAGDSILLRQSWFSLALERQDFDQAAVEIERIQVLGGDEVLLHKLKADRYRYMANYEQAIKHYELALAMQPSRALYHKAAHNYYQWGKTDLAITTTREALDRYPNDYTSLGLLGLIMTEQGDLDGAITTLQRALELQPHATYYIDLGLAYMLAGDYANARTQFEIAYTSSQEPVVMLNIADTEFLLGNTAEATQLYRSIITQSATEDALIERWILSQAYAQLGEFEKAINILKEMNAQGVAATFTAALVYTLAGQNIAAMVEIDHALKAQMGTVWFRLPWFDRLCGETHFSVIMAQAGASDRCANFDVTSSKP